MNAPDLDAIQERLGYRFRDPERLRLALTHRSGAVAAGRHNERLEFFGDAIVGMAVCEHLCDALPESSEGDLSLVKGVAVARETFARVLRGPFWRAAIRVGGGMKSRREFPDSVYANVFEALMAAVYYDSGRDYPTVRDMVLRLLETEISAAAACPRRDNPKALLQEWAQRQGGEIVYSLVARRGADHCPVFTVAAAFAGRELARGEGDSKKAAEQVAARAALRSLGLGGA